MAHACRIVVGTQRAAIAAARTVAPPTPEPLELPRIRRSARGVRIRNSQRRVERRVPDHRRGRIDRRVGVVERVQTGQRWPYRRSFVGVLTTRHGHRCMTSLRPTTSRCLWNRLQMTDAFMALVDSRIVGSNSTFALGLAIVGPDDGRSVLAAVASLEAPNAAVTARMHDGIRRDIPIVIGAVDGRGCRRATRAAATSIGCLAWIRVE